MSASRPVAVVTGGGRGLGRNLAVGLAAGGWDVAVLGRTPTDLDSAADEIRTAGGGSVAMEVDVRDWAGVSRVMRAVEDELGPIAGLVVNAGVQRLGAALDVTADDWDNVVGTNLTGAFTCLQAAGRLMVSREQGAWSRSPRWPASLRYQSAPRTRRARRACSC